MRDPAFRVKADFRLDGFTTKNTKNTKIICPTGFQLSAGASQDEGVGGFSTVVLSIPEERLPEGGMQWRW
jgi:hypothetical protein